MICSISRNTLSALLALLCLTMTARADPAPDRGQQRVPLGDGRVLVVSAPKRLPPNALVRQGLTRPALHGVRLSVTRNRFVSGNVRAPRNPDARAVLLHVTVNGRVLPPVTLSFGATRDSAKPVLAPDGSSAVWVEHGGVYGSTLAVVPATDADKAAAPPAP